MRLTTWSGLVRLGLGAVRVHITNISEAKAQLSALIERVLRGEEVIIGKAGKPVARIVKYERREAARQPGALAGRITIADDFDALPDDIAEAFGVHEP
jgi:prevent-host-death family protein